MCCCKRGTLVVRHIQKASNASCGKQRNCGHMGQEMMSKLQVLDAVVNIQGPLKTI